VARDGRTTDGMQRDSRPHNNYGVLATGRRFAGY